MSQPHRLGSRLRHGLATCVQIIILVLVQAPDGAAQQMARGTIETTLLSGGGFAPAPTNTGARYLVLRSLAYFLDDSWQLALGLGLSGENSRAPSSVVQVEANFHFPAEEHIAVPYCGLQGGVLADIIRAHPRATASIGAQTGMKFFLSGETSLNAQIGYSTPPDSMADGFVTLSIGVSFFRASSSHRSPDSEADRVFPLNHPQREDMVTLDRQSPDGI